MSEALGFLEAREDHRRVLEAATGRGGDLADLFVERTSHLTVEHEEGRVKQLAFGLRQGAGIRVVVGCETGYVHSDDLDLSRLEEAARLSARIASAPPSIDSSRFVLRTEPSRVTRIPTRREDGM